MNRLARTSICALAACGGLAASAGPALADSYSLSLSAPSTAVVGQPVVIQASGVNPPPSEYWAASWIDVGAISASVISSCPANEQSGLGVASSTGGKIVTIAERPNLDEFGNFLNTMGWTPYAPGRWLICGYQDDGAGLTLASAVATIDVQAAPSAPPPSSAPPAPAQPGPTAPANVKRPHVKRTGLKLVCSPGRWTNNTGGYSFGWLVNGKAKPGATARKLKVSRGLHGRKVQCQVTASGAGGKTASAVSAALRVR
jgi:hypothetical protein